MAGPMRLQFDPPAMRSYASTLGRAAQTLHEAADGLRSAVGGAGSMPPGVAEAVRRDTAAASDGLHRAAEAYQAAARYVTRSAQQAVQVADGGAGFHASAALGAKVLRHGKTIVVELDKHVNDPGAVKRGAKTVEAAKLLADLSGVKGLQHLAALDKYRTAFRDAQGLAGKSRLGKVAKTYRTAVQTSLDSKLGASPPRGPGGLSAPKAVPDTAGKRAVHTLAGAAPLAGNAADVAQLKADLDAYRKNPSLRNRIAVHASQLHVASDGAQALSATPAAPVAVPVAGLTEAEAMLIDAGVLAYDARGEIKKLPGVAVDIAKKGGPGGYVADQAIRHAPEVGHKAVAIGGSVVHAGGEVGSKALDVVERVSLPLPKIGLP